MTKRNKSPDFSSHAKKILKARPRMVAIESVKFFKECFVKGGFTDESFIQWKKHQGPLGGKKVLIGKGNTMNLMQSIRTLEESPQRVRTGTDLVYGKMHNEGGLITVTLKMKKFWWAKYYEFAAKIRKTPKKGITSMAKENRQVSAKAEYCRNMALMKVGSKIKIPKRQFIGESRTLIKQFEKWWAQQIDEFK